MLCTCILLCNYIISNGRHLECHTKVYSTDKQATISKKYSACDVEVIKSSAFSAGSVTSHQLKLPFVCDGQIESAASPIPLVYCSVLLPQFCLASREQSAANDPNVTALICFSVLLSVLCSQGEGSSHIAENSKQQL